MADLLFKAVDLIALRAFYSKHRANISITLFKWLKLVKEVEKSHFDILRTKYVKRLYVQFGQILDHGCNNVGNHMNPNAYNNFTKYLSVQAEKYFAFSWPIVRLQMLDGVTIGGKRFRADHKTENKSTYQKLIS